MRDNVLFEVECRMRGIVSGMILVLLLFGSFMFASVRPNMVAAETSAKPNEDIEHPRGEERSFTAKKELSNDLFTGMSTSSTLVYVDPPVSAANPGSLFTLNLSISNVTDLYCWQFKLKWSIGLLKADVENVTEGSFLKQGGRTTLAKKVLSNYVDVSCSLLSANSGVGGSGVLVSVTLKVLKTGNTTLKLYFTKLLNSTLSEIPCTTLDGYFYTTWPVASFYHLPVDPQTDETVTFNASASYDSDGVVVSYMWDFGDGRTGVGITSTHSYSNEGSYTVVLQVTDDDGFFNDAKLTIYVYERLLAYISVPYHRQINGYYCGPASLEMLFDFYGPDIPQREIGDVARTAPDGTYTDWMMRAAHFSNLSTSTDGQSEPIIGYSARSLGYAAFECWDMTLDQLKSIITAGYPIIVLTTWHYRVAVGYSDTRITFQDSNYGENTSMPNELFDNDWDYSNHWALFVCPWQIEINTPSNVSLGSIFNVTARITYPTCPPFPTWQYPASSTNVTITLPTELSLGPNETHRKTLTAEDFTAGTSLNVTWTVQAHVHLGIHTISVEAEGKVAGSVPSFPEPYDYEDRIGAYNQSFVEVLSSPDPTENIHQLIEAICAWSLSTGTKNCLIPKLKVALHLLNINRMNEAVHKLEIFISKVQFMRGKKLTSEQVHFLISKTQETIDLIQN